MTRDSPSDPRRTAARPVAIGRVAGWLHTGSAHGVLLCGAQGFEGLSCHLGWHILADMLAARGLTVLRFDYAGEGDSLGRPDGLTLADAAIADATAAAQWLKSSLGIRRLSCVGLRFGALVASEAFRQGAEIDQLALLAPPASGRMYVRQMRLAARFFADSRGYPPSPDGLIDLCGFQLPAGEAARISAMTLAPPPACPLLVLDPPDAAPSDLLAGGETASSVTQGPFEGYAEFMLDPSHSVTPFAAFDRVTDWIAGADVGPALAEVELHNGLSDTGFAEDRVLFGADRHLAGVLCRPSAPGVCRATVLMLNAGANAHAGWARSAVEQARVLAAEGIASLRMDLSGLGDSIWTADGPRPWLYSEQHIADALAAVDFLESVGLSRPHVAGLCAGGYVAFHAGARDARIASVVAANVLRLIWTETDDLDAYERDNIQTIAAYGDQFRSGRALKRIFAGEVSPLRLLEVAGKLAAKGIAGFSRRLGLTFSAEAGTTTVRAALLAITGRGSRITFVHSDRDQSIPEAERHFGPDFRFACKQKGTAFATIPHADHELTPQKARDHYLDIIRQQVKGM